MIHRSGHPVRAVWVAAVLGLIVLAPLAGAAVPRPAGPWNVTPIIGYRSGGGINNGTYEVADGVAAADLDIQNSFEFGLILDYQLPIVTLMLEASWDHQATQLDLERREEGTSETLFDLYVDYFQLGILYQLPEHEVWPFIGITFGATVLNPAGSEPSAEARFSAGLLLGVKGFFSPRVGWRVHGRWMSTYLPASDQVFCDGDDFCYSVPQSAQLSQIDLAAGVIIAF